ncbi:MAG: nitroreductase family protein [Desulfobulbaceae bacterium]|nr:nitroreductase family protein [Desulfobulbaceae bacterium]
MTKSLQHNIDRDKCTGCGECVRVCPDKVLSVAGGTVEFSGEKCLACGHCVAVCPVQALSLSPLSLKMHFQTFDEKLKWLPFGQPDTSDLVRFMRSRRSCRNFSTKEIAIELLADLVKIGTTAPSGTNSQGWTFTVLQNRSQVTALGKGVAGFFKGLNKKAENPLLRLFAKLFLKDSLGRYHRRYYQTIKSGLEEWEKQGKDLLFHGATAAILVGGTSRASCPSEDAMLATQNILLAAHSMGIGSCLIGFAVEAIRRESDLKKHLMLAADEEIYSVIALGYPQEKYSTVTGRKSIEPRIL